MEMFVTYLIWYV